MRLLRGAPGSKVTLTVIRGNAAEPRQIELVREKTPGAVVTGKMLGTDVGYIRIASFGAGRRREDPQRRPTRSPRPARSS